MEYICQNSLGPRIPVSSGLSPRAVTWASLSAEDEVDMLNDRHGSEETISVPSCYGRIGAPVSRQGESRGPKGSGCPAAGEGPREGMGSREAWHPLLPAGADAAAPTLG